MSSRRFRYAAPVVVTGLIAAGAWLPTLQASASPDLPAITATHLVEKALGERVTHLSGSFSWTADLGLPSLGDLTGGSGQGPSTSSGFQATSLLSGTHSFEVWVDGAARQRIAAPGTLAETDVVHNGNQTWVYDSSTNHVTRYLRRTPARPVGGMTSLGDPGLRAGAAPTPATVADQFLAGIRSLGSRIAVTRPVDVAGRASYVLCIWPNRAIAANRASTISYVTVAIDARTGLPLRTAVYAVGQKAAALQVGFTTVSYGTPSASEFVAPEGQSTSTKLVGPSASPVRSGWYGYAPLTQASGPTVGPGGVVVAVPGSVIDTRGKILTTRGLTTGELNAVRRQAVAAAAASTRGGPSQVNARWAQGPVTLPITTSATAAAGRHDFTYPPRITSTTGAKVAHNWGAVWTLDSGTMNRAMQSELDSLTTAVSGRWGSGRLLTSSLVNVLVLSDGRVLVGAVNPAALEAAAAHSSR